MIKEASKKQRIFIKYCPNIFLNILDDNKKEFYKKIKLFRFSKKYSYEGVFSSNEKISKIKEGAWGYTYFNICFLNNMLGNIIYILEKGNIPFIDVRSTTDNSINIWEWFFEQPFGLSSKKIIHSSSYTEDCDIKQSPFKPDFNSIYDEEELKIWSKVYSDFVVFNKQTKSYIFNEYNYLIKKDMRVLGVLCRGTDYITLKPKWHPIQPTVEMVIELAHKKMKEFNLDYIYLATDEKAIEEKFQKEFPGKILINKRTYYDEQYYNNEDITLIGQVKFNRENDDYYKGLEYLSSLYILSKCNALIGGNCGGSCAALYMNNGKYEDWDIFNLGLYGVDDIN